MQCPQYLVAAMLFICALTGPQQCQGAPMGVQPALFKETTAFFRDFMEKFAETARKFCIVFSGLAKPRIPVLPPRVASPTKTVNTITEPDNSLQTSVGLRSGFTQPSQTKPTVEGEKIEKDIIFESLYEGGPIYAYETVTVKVRNGNRFRDTIGNDLDTSESQNFMIKKIKVPIRRMDPKSV